MPADSSAIESFIQESNERERAQAIQASNSWRLFWAFLLLTPTALMIPYFIEMWQLDRYRYFPFVFLSVGALAYLRSDHVFGPPRGWFSRISIGFALLMVVAGAMMRYPWFAVLGFVIIATCCLSMLKGPRDRTLVGLAIPLLLLLRLPFRSDAVFVSELQGITTTLSSLLLDVLAVPHSTKGNVMVLADRELFVAEACSGVQSVFTLAFIACLLVSYKRIRLWLFPIYLVVAVLLAIATNTLRVTTIAVADAWLAFDLTSGFAHELLGYACLLIGFGFLLSFDQLIAIFFHGIAKMDQRDENPLFWIWNKISLSSASGETAGTKTPQTSLAAGQEVKAFRQFALPIRVTFAVTLSAVFLFSVVQIWRSQRRQTIAVDSGSLLFEPPTDLLDGFNGYVKVMSHEITRGGNNPRLGANSDLWNCESETVNAQFVLSQPHSGWKELCICYEGTWNLVDRSVGRPPLDDPAGPFSTYAIGRFRGFKKDNESNQVAYLFFSAIRPDGTVMAAPTQLGSLGTRLMHRLDYGGVWELDDVMMLQMWVVAGGKLDPQVVSKLQSDFVAVRGRVIEAARSRNVVATASKGGMLDSRPLAFRPATKAQEAH